MTAAPEDKPIHVASDWFNRQRSGDMSAEEVRTFELWLRRDPENEAAFKRVEATWGFISDFEDDPAILSARELDERKLDARARGKLLGAIAAGLAITATAGWTAQRVGWLPENLWGASAPMQEFRTSVGQRTTVTLLDHSVVTLDTDTILHARLTGRERHIELIRGQAFFQVAKDRHRPFIVAADGRTVRAVGTAFDVRTEPGRFQVTLIEGRVRVQEQGDKRNEGATTEMRPGWRLTIGEDARWRMEPVNLNRETSWHDGLLAFFNEPLEDAATEMNRYSQRKIVFRGVAPQAPVLGSFRAGDVESFVRAAQLNGLVRVHYEGEDRIELSARN